MTWIIIAAVAVAIVFATAPIWGPFLFTGGSDNDDDYPNYRL